MEQLSGHHFIAVFGGAVAGSEAAFQLANRGFRVVVFDQNTLPYGKIEDGLPKWHEKLRDKEESKINEKLSHPNITFVPNIELGKDIDFQDLVNNWGFTAILLATGAWKDRPLPIDGINDYIDKGLYYQNPFVYWYNHFHEPGFNGKSFEVRDGAIVIGGGLASLDVVKILMMETVEKKLAEKGIITNMFKLDRGINRVLDEHSLTLDDLGLKGATLFYRRRAIDMPLSSLPTNTEEELQKAQSVRQKILDNYQKKYLFKFEPCWSPVGFKTEGDRLSTIDFQKTEIIDGKVVPVDGKIESFNAPLFVSSIGSIPELIEGIPARGQVFDVDESNACQISGYNNVFALGNAVTGRGNIIESHKHGRDVAQKIMDERLNWKEEDYQNWLRLKETSITDEVNQIAHQINGEPDIESVTLNSIQNKIAELQQKTGYNGDFMAWVKEKLPVRLEEILENLH